MAKIFDPGRIRTCNPLIRSQMPYPLGHAATGDWRVHSKDTIQLKLKYGVGIEQLWMLLDLHD